MKPFVVLFPAFCHGLREPDPEFFREAQALESLGIPWQVVDVSALSAGDLTTALRFFQEAPASLIIYRGWILHPEEFAALHDALAHRGCRMLTSAAAYRRALLFPEFFPTIADHSIPAVWTEDDNPKHAVAAARQLGAGPYFIKDFAKSAKEIWPTGCVAVSEHELPAAIEALKEYRGDRFEGGVVIRPLIALHCLGEGPFGRNIFEEYRLFFLRGRLITKSAYDHLGGNLAALPDYRFLPQRILSPFFSADAVVSEAGETYLLEVGDGGTSALPPSVSTVDFYAAILETLADEDTPASQG